uniref:Uncharacterized protein n=1 Tax=Knipowitschia caucasica TaxID=637954 RepID=A0AAV2M608_KNICA
MDGWGLPVHIKSWSSLGRDNRLNNTPPEDTDISSISKHAESQTDRNLLERCHPTSVQYNPYMTSCSLRDRQTYIHLASGSGQSYRKPAA